MAFKAPSYLKGACLIAGMFLFLFQQGFCQHHDYVQPQEPDEVIPLVFQKERWQINMGANLFSESFDLNRHPSWNNYSRTSFLPVIIAGDYIVNKHLSLGLFSSHKITSIDFIDSVGANYDYIYYKASLGFRVNFHVLSFLTSPYSSMRYERRFDIYVSAGYAGFLLLEAAEKNDEVIKAEIDFSSNPVAFIGMRYAFNDYIGAYIEGFYGEQGFIGMGITVGFGGSSTGNPKTGNQSTPQSR